MVLKPTQMIATAILTMGCSYSALAAEWYVSGYVGKSWQTEDVTPYGNNIAVDADFPSTFDSGDSGIYGIGVGYYIDTNLRIEARISNREAEFAETRFGTGAREGEEYVLDGELESTVYSIDLFYDFQVNDSFKPYIKAGLGLAQNDFSSKLGGAGVAAFDAFDGAVDGFYDLYADQSDDNFSWNIGFGTSYVISEEVELFAEYQYVMLGDVATGQDAFTDGFNIDGAAANEVMLGIIARF